MIELYANISFGHENDWSVIERRVISAAQCNADAIVFNKSNPHVAIPEFKKYVSIPSKWGHLPYIEVAKNSEIDLENTYKLQALAKQIGIQLIWSTTDMDSAAWIKENTECDRIKIHYDSSTDINLVQYCLSNFNKLIYCGNDEDINTVLKYVPGQTAKQRITLYHTTKKFPPQVEELNLGRINQLQSRPHVSVGYEGRSIDIFPDCAVVFKNVNYIEKYLGDDDSQGAILSPQKFYDFFVNMNQLEIAND